MGRLISIAIFIGSFICLTASAQTDSTIKLTENAFLQGSYIKFYVDNLNNIYLLNAGNQVKKVDDKGDSIAVSNALKKFGDIHSMDISNALKIIVYYKDFTTIIVLDRFLKTVNTIDLRRYGILQAQAVAISYDNNYWVFDEVENKLKKIDDNGNLLLSTPDLRTVFDDAFLPEKIIDYDGAVYLYNKSQGFKIFDYYGSLKQSVPLINRRNIQVVKNSILSFADSMMYAYNIPVFTEKSYAFTPPIQDGVKFQKIMNTLYVLKSDGLHVYSAQ